MDSKAGCASSCLCRSFNGHQRPLKSANSHHNHQFATEDEGSLHATKTNRRSASPEVPSGDIPSDDDVEVSLSQKPDSHKTFKSENSTSCDKIPSTQSPPPPPSFRIQGPNLLKDNSARSPTHCPDGANFRSESDVSDRLYRLRITQSDSTRKSSNTAEQTCSSRVKSELTDLATNETASKDSSTEMQQLIRSSSSEEFLDSIRSTQNLDSSCVTSKGCSRVPSIKYNTIRDSCTVAQSSQRPIYPSLPYSPICTPVSSPNLTQKQRTTPVQCLSDYTQLYQYKVLGEIGRGSFGVVKLAYNEEDHNYYAMKILSKRKLMRRAGLYGRLPPRRDGQKPLKSPLEQLSREIAILKKLNHVNIVKLFEVLNESDGDNLYMVFELVERGPVIQLPTKCPLSEEKAWQYFRDMIMGIEYLHFQKIIHRDIKPSNLLLSNNERIQISDFGVCNQFEGVDAFLSDTSGTPAFVPPEALKGTRTRYSGKALDVWQMGVSLYSLVYGCVPYEDPNVLSLYTKIRSNPLQFPSEPCISNELKDLMQCMLQKDPDLRFKLKDVKSHVWVTKNDSYPLPAQEVNAVEVTEEEINNCMRPVPKLDTLVLIKSMLKKHSFSHPFKESLECNKFPYTATADCGPKKKTLRKITTCPSVPTYETSIKQQNENGSSHT